MSVTSPMFSQDSFTERLLKVYYDLHKRGSIHKKKDFTDAIGISLNYFHLIERNMRNYARDEEKRKNARAGLMEGFGVNPEYLREHSSKMYIKEPGVKRKEVIVKDEVEYSYYGKKQKQKLQEELSECYKKIEALEAELQDLRALLEQYKSK